MGTKIRMITGLFSIALLACGGDPEAERLALEQELFGDYVRESVAAPGDSIYNLRPCEIEQARGFSEGLAAVKIKGKWGYVDTTARLVIPAVFNEALDFIDGLAKVEKDGQYGLIGLDGRYAIRPILDGCQAFKDSIGFVVVGYNTFIVNLKAGWVSVFDCGAEKGGVFYEGLAHVEKDGKFGFMDSVGSLTIPFRYEQALFFREGLCAVKLNGRWGYIDRDGKSVIEPQFLLAGCFSEGLAAVFEDSLRRAKCVFITKEGQRISDLHFFGAGVVSEGIAPVAVAFKNDNDSLIIKWAYWRPWEKIFLTDYKMDFACHFSESMATAKIGTEWICIDSSLVTLSGTEVDTVTEFKNGRAMIKEKGVWNVIDRHGKRYIPE